eukprot:c13518_g1_i1 orf=420-812(-)
MAPPIFSSIQSSSLPILSSISTPGLLRTSLHGILPSMEARDSVGLFPRRASRLSYRIRSLLGDNMNEGKDKKKFITKKEEPQQYWQTESEKEGTGPMSTPLPYIIILGFLTPFLILGVAFANGWIKVPVR